MPDTEAAPPAGHNTGIAADRLRAFIERIERLDEEGRSISQDKAEVYKEARGAGFDPKVMREIIKLRRMEPDDRQERDSLLDLYKQAMGMLS